MPNLGAAFGQGWEDYLTKQAATKHQAMLDEISRQHEIRLAQEGLDHHAESLAIQHQNELKLQEQIEQGKQKRVEGIVKDVLPGDAITTDIKDQLEAVEPGMSKRFFQQPAPEVAVGPTQDGFPLIQQDPRALALGRGADRKTLEDNAAMKVLGAKLKGAATREEKAQILFDNYPKWMDPKEFDTTLNALAGPKDTTTQPAPIQELEYVNKERAKAGLPPYSYIEFKKALADAGGQGGEGRPYFLPQTEYDAQGRPVGSLSFDARKGTATRLTLPNGGSFKPPQGNLGPQTITNEASQDALKHLMILFDGGTDQNGNVFEGAKQYVGPASGRMYSLGQLIPGVPVNRDFARFSAASATFRNAVIKAITGAQMSESEVARIKQQIPEVSDKPEVWVVKAEETMQNLGLLEARVKTDRDAPKGDTTKPKSKYKVTVEP